MIQIKTKYLIGSLITAIAVLFFIGMGLGRLERNLALESIIENQTQMMNSYVYTISDLQSQLNKKSDLIVSQKNAAKDELSMLKLKHKNEVTKLNRQIITLLDSISHIRPCQCPDIPALSMKQLIGVGVTCSLIRLN